MRPLRVEVEGFTAFRRRVEVSFADTELFALVGPTGAGKSSVIDAMVFALYGKVPRYQDDRVVASVINVQSAEARVRLDFEVDGTVYTAVRVVRRTKTGATTKEARLERGAEVLAADARALDDAVADLLGLSFEQFTKTVVLPQGDFARFLHERPADRQELLVRLLDLGMYGAVASAARERARTAGERAAILDEQLRTLDDVDETTAARHRARAAELDALAETLRGVLDTVAGLDRRIDEIRVAGEARRAEQRALLAVAVPPDVRDLRGLLDTAQAQHAEAIAALDAARAEIDGAAAAVAALPDDTELRDVMRRRERLAELEAVIAARGTVVAEQTAALAGAEAARDSAATVAAAADAALRDAQDRSRAAALRHELHEGEPCPVCEQPVLVVPPQVPDRELDDARDAQRAASRALDAAGAAFDAAARTARRAEAELDAARQETTGLVESLAGAPSQEECAAALAAGALVRERDTALRAAERPLAAAVRDREKAVRALDERARSARRDLTAARDTIAALGPPSPVEHDLLDDWVALVEWCTSTAAAITGALDELLAAHATTRAERDAHLAVIRDACAALGVDPAQPRLLEHVKQLEARAIADADAATERLARKRALVDQLDAVRAAQSVADDLGRLLGANGFQQWLLEEALDELVAGASTRLFSLSSGQFSLERDGKQFAVRDHRNADDLRPIKTLSGGETFLASLALALALADNVAALSASGAPRLESVFLDEGFGSLDPETLDVVASAIEELGASGRMVGVVTHIRELADRLPVRYEVTKLPDSSVVQRIDR